MLLLVQDVLAHRILPGFAHALVFWGFCAFALVSINHFAEGANVGIGVEHSRTFREPDQEFAIVALIEEPAGLLTADRIDAKADAAF